MSDLPQSRVTAGESLKEDVDIRLGCGHSYEGLLLIRIIAVGDPALFGRYHTLGWALTYIRRVRMHCRGDNS